jgi:hypothetical protein
MGIADLIDGVSGYSRGLGQGEKLRRFTEKHGKSLVTVEYSWQLSLYQTLETPQGSFDPFWRLPWYRRVGASLAAIPITSMAWSRSSGFNRYDARYPGGDFTQLDNYKCMFEYDGALKPSAVAYAVAAGLLDGFHGAGELKLHDGLDSFLLEETSTPGAERFALAFWAKGGQLGHTRIRLPESVRGMDVMGNPIRQAPKSMLLCGDVTYLIGPKSQLPATQDLVAKLEIKPVIRSEGKVELDDASGQYLCRVTVTNVLDDEAVKVKVGVNGQRNFWEYPKELPVLNPGQESSAVFGMNVYRWEKANPEVPPHFVFVEALGSSAY